MPFFFCNAPPHGLALKTKTFHFQRKTESRGRPPGLRPASASHRLLLFALLRKYHYQRAASSRGWPSHPPPAGRSPLLPSLQWQVLFPRMFPLQKDPPFPRPRFDSKRKVFSKQAPHRAPPGRLFCPRTSRGTPCIQLSKPKAAQAAGSPGNINRPYMACQPVKRANHARGCCTAQGSRSL